MTNTEQNRAPADAPDRATRVARRRFAIAMALILAFGAAARIYGAWAARRIEDADAAVTALMARHMVEGRAFPVFFYGQGYMGNLEPATAALLGRLFGLNGFWVNFGTALYGWGILLLLLRWGRETGGRAGALAAGLLCMIGPRYYAAFQTVPRGAYMAAILFSMLALRACARMSVRLWRREQVGAGAAVLTGIAAGLAWWGSAVVTSTLAAGALLVAIGLRGRVWNRIALWGALGFLIGSAPFWWWNAHNGWVSLRMTGEVGGIPLRVGLLHLPKAWLRMFQVRDWPDSVNAALTVGALLLGLAGIVAAGIEWRRRGWTPAAAAGFGAAAHLALATYLFAHSDFSLLSAPRYLLPLIPALALLAGISAGALARRRAAGLVFLLAVLALTATHFPHIRRLRDRAAWTAAQIARDRELAAALEAADVEAVYALFSHYGFNFALDERWPFTEPRNERILDYGQRAERADRIAFLEDIFGVSDFIRRSGGRMQTATAGGLRLATAFEPPSAALAEIPTAEWSSVRDARGRDLAAQVGDRDADTAWDYDAGFRERDGIEIRFAAPREVRRLRLTLGEGRFRDVTASVETLDPSSGEWREAHPPHAPMQLFWSGPRPFWIGRRPRLEYALPEGAVGGVRWSLRPGPRGGAPAARAVLEAQLFGPALEPEPPAELAFIDELAARLRELGVGEVHADRWASNALLRRAPELRVYQEPGIWRRSRERGLDAGRIEWRPGTAVVALRHDALQTRAALSPLMPREFAVGPWTVFLAPPDAASEPDGLPPPVFWSGCTAFRGQGRARALERLRAAAARVERGEPAADLLGLLLEMQQEQPDLLAAADPALRRIAASCPAALPPEALAEWRCRTVPEIPLAVEFAGGLRLEGVTAKPGGVKPGEAVRLRYIWRIPPPERERRQWAAFAHFSAGAVRFQDDHNLPDAAPHAALFDAEAPGLFFEDRTVVVPPDAPAGPVELAIGVYDNATRARLALKTSRPTRDRAALARVFDVIKTDTP